MSGAELAVWVLLAIAVLAQVAGVVGTIAGANVYERLHFIGPSGIFGPIAIAAAIVIDEGPVSQAGLKSMLVAVLLLALSPILIHATARSAYVRERGSLALPDRMEEGEG